MNYKELKETNFDSWGIARKLFASKEKAMKFCREVGGVLYYAYDDTGKHYELEFLAMGCIDEDAMERVPFMVVWAEIPAECKAESVSYFDYDREEVYTFFDNYVKAKKYAIINEGVMFKRESGSYKEILTRINTKHFPEAETYRYVVLTDMYTED